MDVLANGQIEAALQDLEGWSYDGDALVRTFRFADFVAAIDFVDDVAEIAETFAHHPDIDIRYNKVTLRCSTHSAGGITAKDVELAGLVSARV